MNELLHDVLPDWQLDEVPDGRMYSTVLRSRTDQFPLMLELREVPGMKNPLGEVTRVFEDLEALEFSHD